MTDQELHHFEVEIRSADSKGGVGVTHIEYKTRLDNADDVPHEIAVELQKSLGRDCVSEIETDR
jgi:hypothetical protein